MEIILAFLLFFGGFTMGSISAEDEEPQATTARPPANGTSDAPMVTPARRQSGPRRCHSDRAILYKDLTVPIGDRGGHKPGEANGGEGVRPDD